jgi:hypothetical protein
MSSQNNPPSTPDTSAKPSNQYSSTGRPPCPLAVHNAWYNVQISNLAGTTYMHTTDNRMRGVPGWVLWELFAINGMVQEDIYNMKVYECGGWSNNVLRLSVTYQRIS